MADPSGSDAGGDRVKTHRNYVCEDSLEGILTAVHVAYMSRYGHEYQSIQAGDYASLYHDNSQYILLAFIPASKWLRLFLL